MSKKTPTQRIARLEGIVAGAGFLLLKLHGRYGHDFGEGLSTQVQQCIHACHQVVRAREQREAAASIGEKK